MTSLNFTRGDYGFRITLTLTDNAGTAVDLSDGGGDATVKLKMALRGATSLSVEGTCTVSDASNGVCYYTVVAADFNTAGIYDAEVEAVWSVAAREQKWKFEKISIDRDLPYS